MGWRHFPMVFLDASGFTEFDSSCAMGKGVLVKCCKWTCDVNQHRLSRWCSDFYFPCIIVHFCQGKLKIKLKPQGDHPLLWREVSAHYPVPEASPPPKKREVPRRHQQFFYGIAEAHFDFMILNIRLRWERTENTPRKKTFNKLVLSSSFCNKIFKHKQHICVVWYNKHI